MPSIAYKLLTTHTGVYGVLTYFREQPYVLSQGIVCLSAGIEIFIYVSY